MSEHPKDDDQKNINSEQAFYVMVSHLNHTTRLYRDLLRIVIELKKLPTMRAGVFPAVDDETIM